MSKSISKPRTSGGQPQSNQRQNMPEFQRQDRSSYPLRQANAQGVHSVTQNPIAQVNMHPPHPQPQTPQIAASQVMQSQPNIMRPYAGTHTQQNPQTLVPQQQIPVGHVNSNPPQQANVMPQHVMRNNQSFQYQLPTNRMPMTAHRPQYANHHHRNNNAVPAQQIPNMAPQAQNIYYLPYGYNLHMPQMMAPVNYNQMIQISDPYQIQRGYNAASQPQMTMPNNIQPNEMMNQNIYQPQQPQPPKTENKKREKKILQVFDENGKEINLSELANDKSAAPAKESSDEKSSNETKDSALDKVPPSQTLNGTELDKEDGPSDASPKLDDSKTVEPVIFESDDKVQVDDSIQVVSSENETSNVVCDNEIIQDTSESLTDKPDVQVEELAEKVQEIVLQETSESTDIIEVTATKEDSAASVQENDSEVVSATTISGDMEVDTGKGVGEPSIDERIEESNANEEQTPPPATKDDDDIEEKDLEPKLSRNSSQNGSRVYDKDFLLSLRDHATDHAISMSNPDNMKDIIKRNNKASTHDMFIPTFATQGRSSQNDSYRNKSQGQAVRRPSQPSKNYQDSKSRKITSTSLHQQYDIYTPAENAWKPGKVNTDDPTEAETENLLKNVRAILNKLTPQNYHTLLGQFKEFKIDTKNRLTRVIDLIFDKAVKEPSFVVQYAGFCSELIHIKVTETNAKNETVEVKFKNLLIKKCEETFFKEMYSDIDQFEVKLKEIDECTDEKKKKELEEIMDDEKRYSRRRSIGNIKLIAELYKLNMLNAKIMFACFMNLLKHQHEEYIECLCALITNIGKDLTNAINFSKSKSSANDQMETFESIFTQLKAIHDQKSMPVSSRIRFMILDLLDLRKNNWVPRRKADGPKTIAQVHEDMDKEARLKSLELSEQRKKKTYGGPRDQEEWQQVSSRKGKGSSVTGQGKLSISNLNVLKESLSASSKPALGSGSPFGMFAHGSHGGTNSNSQSRSSSSTFENKYHVLSNEKNPKSNSTFHDSLNAKDQLRRDERKTSDVTNYYQSNRDNSQPNSRNSSTRSDIYEVKTHIDISPEVFSTKLKSLVDTQGKALNVEQGTQDVVAFCSKNRFNAFICDSILIALDKPSAQRQNWGQFLGHLFVYTISDSSEIFEGFKGVFQNSDDFLIDLPKFWEFVAEIIANALLKVYESNDPRTKEILKAASKAFGEVTGRGYIKLSSSITESITKMIDGDASDILSQLQFNSQTNAKNDIQCPESNQQSELKTIVNGFFEQFIKSNCEISTLENQLNIDKVDSKKFVSALFYKVVKHYIDIKENNNASEQTKLFEILRHYVKLNDDSQVELLFVSSEVCRDLNHPSNLLSELFTLFSKEKFATKEAFEQWKTSKRAFPLAVLSVERTLKLLFP